MTMTAQERLALAAKTPVPKEDGKGWFASTIDPATLPPNEIPLKRKYLTAVMARSFGSAGSGNSGQKNLKGLPWAVGLRKYPKRPKRGKGRRK